MTKRLTKEGWGLTSEVAGLLFVLVAAGFQFGFLDWFTKNDRAAINMAQASVNEGILRTLQDLSEQINTPDQEQRKLIQAQIVRTTSWALRDADDLNRTRVRLANGQASIAKNIYTVLYLLGAAMIVLGKGLVARHKIEESRPAQISASDATANDVK